MDALIAELAEVPGLERVYVNGVPRPSFVANLVPLGNERERLQGDSNYFPAYKTAFSTGRASQLTGTQVKAADELVADVNKRLTRRVLEANERLSGPRFVFLDINGELLDVYDRKHRPQAEAIEVSLNRAFLPGRRVYSLTNLPVVVQPGRFQLGATWIGISATQGEISA